MAEEHDSRISQRYRELGAEEPPHHLDQAILAASRRRGRWYYPVAAAAVIVLAVAVTWHMQAGRPDPESALPMQAPRPAREVLKAQKQAEEARADSAARRFTDEAPEKVLERIKELREQGRHEEADKALAAFRKRHPGYKIPESALRK